jgi:beta-ureidopropionase
MEMGLVHEVRDRWQFFRDRRPEAYGRLTADE